MNSKSDVNRRVLAIQAKKKRHKPGKRKGKPGPPPGAAAAAAATTSVNTQNQQQQPDGVEQQSNKNQPSREGQTGNAFSKDSSRSDGKPYWGYNSNR